MIVEENRLGQEGGRPGSTVGQPKQTERLEKDAGKDAKSDQSPSDDVNSLSRFTVKANMELD